MINELEHIDLTIGVDGNAAFALFGENLQEGESEFVEITAPYGENEINIAKVCALQALAMRTFKNDLL